jgi:pyruvate dehydrogenase E1 component alpha subunit
VIEAEADRAVTAAVDYADASPAPAVSTLFDYVYASPVPSIHQGLPGDPVIGPADQAGEGQRGGRPAWR